MPVNLQQAAIELELNGVGGGWTDVSRDVRIKQGGVKWRYGITGAGPLDCVARPGLMTFALNNAENNSARTIGYYSPDHANVRTGFASDIRCRLRLTYGGTTRTKFIGRLLDPIPMPGLKRDRVTTCTVVDFMEDAVRHKLNGIPLQVGQRSDTCIQAILDNMATSPIATSLATGIDTFAYAMDSSRDESMYAATEMQKVCQSEDGRCYVKGDGTFVFESRHTRPAIYPNSFVLDNSMMSMQLDPSSRLRFSQIQAITHPRQVDALTVTLYQLRTVTEVKPGESIPIFGGYTDPNGRASRTGGFDMVTPVATTDYTMNAAADGSGTNLTASFSVTMSAGFLSGGNGFYATITNNAAVTGYITFFRVRGKGIYDYENATVSADDPSVPVNVLTWNMPYQNDPAKGLLRAEYAKRVFNSSRTQVRAVTFSAQRSASHMVAALDADISTRVGVLEDVAGLTDVGPGGTNVGWFINACEGELRENNQYFTTWQLTPADQVAYWLLGIAGASELGVTTRLGY